MINLLIVIAVNFVAVHLQSVLSTVSFPSFTTSTSIPTNFVGISVSFDQLNPDALTSQLFKDYIKNFWTYGNFWSSLGISLKMQYPPGYKFDCASWDLINPNATCTTDVSALYPTTIGSFFSDTSNSGSGLSIGFDR